MINKEEKKNKLRERMRNIKRELCGILRWKNEEY
jgi:hypothetical protein